METARRTTIATLLLALAIVAFATAAVTLTNITEWTVKAQGSPVVKVAGNDSATGYVSVTSDFPGDGTNRTKITVVGFKGDPTNYTSVLKICNKNFTGPVTVKLVYKGLSYPKEWPPDVIYVILFNSTNKNTLISLPSGSTEATIGPIPKGQCSSDIGVSVLVSPDAPTNTELVKFEVDVESTG